MRHRVAPVAFALLLICGCIMPPPPPVDPVTPFTPPKSVATRADLCAEISAQIDAKNIDTTDELVRVIRLLQDGGNWTAADSAAVDAVLPDLASTNRKLTPDDSARLKAVK